MTKLKMKLKLLSAVVALATVLVASPVWATFPQVVATTTTLELSNTLTPIVGLPACSAGNLFIVVGSGDSAIAAATWPGNWTELIDDPSADGNTNITVGYLVSTGGESTVQVTFTGTADQSAWLAHCVSGWHGTSVPEAGITTESASGGNPDPPSLTPSWGAEDTLWIAVGTSPNSDSVGDQFTSAPLNYTNLINVDSPDSSTPPSVGSAQRELSAVSDDPGAFTIDTPGTAEALANTIAVRPAAASPTRPKVIFIQ